MRTERYPATVLATDEGADDGEKRGRIKVACAGILGDEETELPMWVEPVHEWGWFFIPDVGEVVEVEVVTGDDDDEQFGQSSIDNLDIKWRGLRYHTNPTLDDTEKNEARPIHQDFTATAYGKRRGFATPWGHVFLFDDTDGAPTIQLTFMKEKLNPPDAAPEPEKYTRVEIEADGSLKVGMLNKHVLHLQSEGKALLVTLDEAKNTMLFDATNKIMSVELDEGKNKLAFDAANKALSVELDEQKFTLKMDGAAKTLEVKLDSGASLKIEGKDANCKATIGDGAKHVAIVEALEQFYGKLKSKLDAFDKHVHPTGMGPSGPPNPPITADPWDTKINSTKISIPDA